MHIRMLVALLAVALSLGLVACGGNDDDAEPPAEVEREAPDEPEAPAEAEEVSEVTLVDFAFEPQELVAEEGTTLTLMNEGNSPHDLRVREDGEDVGGTPVFDPDETEEFAVDVEPGEYEIFCSVPGHEEAGMVGTLTVE